VLAGRAGVGERQQRQQPLARKSLNPEGLMELAITNSRIGDAAAE